MFAYLMISKLIYLLIKWETISKLPAFEQIRAITGLCISSYYQSYIFDGIF